MRFDFEIPFVCPPDIKPFLQKVFSGEYDVPLGFPQGTRIIDLGANCGSFSVWATHRWPGCLIHAYEPHPKTFGVLTENIKGYQNIVAHNWGIGSPGIRILNEGKHNSGESSFHSALNNPCPTGQHLEVLDPLTLPEADIIKLDIEGCEMEVLGPLIEEKRTFDLIMLEWHSESLRRRVDLLLKDYDLIGCEVQHICGRGVSKYLRKGLLMGIET